MKKRDYTDVGDELMIRFAHSTHWKKLRWNEFPSSMPHTWYHIGEKLELKYLYRSSSQSTNHKIDSGFLAIHHKQWKQYETWRNDPSRYHHCSGLYQPKELYKWLQKHCISPFDVLRISDTSSDRVCLILFRIPRDERLRIYNDRFHNTTWVYELQKLYREYEQKIHVDDQNDDDEEEQEQQSQSSNQQDGILLASYEKENKEIESFIDSHTLPMKFNFRPSYMTEGFFFYQYIKRQRRLQLEERQHNNNNNNNGLLTRGMCKTLLQLQSDGPYLSCARIIPSVHGVLKRERIELTVSNYHSILHMYDLSKMVIYENTFEHKQYVLRRDLHFDNEKNVIDHELTNLQNVIN